MLIVLTNLTVITRNILILKTDVTLKQFVRRRTSTLCSSM